MALTALTSCHKDEAPILDGAERTVLIYMAAQNSLGGSGFQRSDSAEVMKGCKEIPLHGRVMMFIDDKRAPRLYEVMNNMKEPKLVRQWDTDVCSTDPSTLEDVLGYVRQHFPSREYGLVMWSHADGWIPATDTGYAHYASLPSVLSFGIDSGPNGDYSNQGAQMNVADMAHAVANAGMHCKFIFFDSCLMQNLEVAYALRQVCDYVIASPMATPAAGSYYTNNIKRGFFSNDPADLARTYLQDVKSNELSYSYGDFGLSISCIQTDKLEALAEAVRQALPHSSLMNHGEADLDGVLNYQAYTRTYYYRPHNYDARQALRAILPDEYFQQVCQALDEAVTYYGSTSSFWIGPGEWNRQTVPVESNDFRAVSLFIPQTIYTNNASLSPHGDLNQAFQRTEWYTAAGWSQTGW